jgi:hypothetical protein
MNAHTLLVGEQEGKRQLGRPRLRSNNINLNLGEIGSGGLDFNDLA